MSALEATPDDSFEGHDLAVSAARTLRRVGRGERRQASIAKEVVDRVGAVSLLLVMAPVLILIALVVRFTSSGPAFFSQTRIGRNGVPFTMYKFRTMCNGAEDLLEELVESGEGPALLFKMEHDPRITRFGRLLRRSSLDELPQLFNVVLGHMSMIGPRPSLPREAEEYDEWSRRRLNVKPGMTGLWQVSGRSHLSWEDSLRLDVEYVDTWSMRTDFKIAFRTVCVVVTGRGAM